MHVFELKIVRAVQNRSSRTALPSLSVAAASYDDVCMTQVQLSRRSFLAVVYTNKSPTVPLQHRRVSVQEVTTSESK
jgi:hypothetical protein